MTNSLYRVESSWQICNLLLVAAGDAWIPLGETLRKSGNQPWDISILLFVGKKNKQYLDWQKYMFERKKIPSKPTKLLTFTSPVMWSLVEYKSTQLYNSCSSNYLDI